MIEKIMEKLNKRICDAEKVIMENPIDKLDEIANDTAEAFIEAYKECIDIVNQAAVEHNNGWIPVSERLPDEPGEVDDLDDYPEYIVIIQHAKKATTLRYTGSGEWYDSITQDFYSIDAWQPLPDHIVETNKTITNADRIRSMTDEELAEFLSCWECESEDKCEPKFEHGQEHCDRLFKFNSVWLQSEVTDA